MSNLTMGTSEELAFKCAFKRCFIESTLVLSARHQKTKLFEIHGRSRGLSITRLLRTFWEICITAVTDIDTHNLRIRLLTQTIETTDVNVGSGKMFKPYWG